MNLSRLALALLFLLGAAASALAGCRTNLDSLPTATPQLAEPTFTLLPDRGRCRDSDVFLPTNMCNAFYVMQLTMEGEADVRAIAAARGGYINDGYAMWDGPTARDRSYRLGPWYELYQVMVKFAVNEQGDMLAGIVPQWSGVTEPQSLKDAPSQALGFLTASPSGDLDLKQTLLWEVLQLEHSRIRGHITGGVGLGGDVFIINNYDRPVFLLHSAIIIADAPGGGIEPIGVKWSPVSAVGDYYRGAVNRTFELGYKGREHSYVYADPVTANPLGDTNVASKVRFRKNASRWMTERAYLLDSYPKYVELTSSIEPAWRTSWIAVNVVYVGESMAVSEVSENPALGDNPPPDILVFPKGMSLGIPYSIFSDEDAMFAYEQARAILTSHGISDAEKRERLRVVQQEAKQEALAEALRHLPVYSYQQRRTYTFDTYVNQLVGDGATAGSDAPIMQDPAGASLRIFFDPSTDTIREMLGLEETPTPIQ